MTSEGKPLHRRSIRLKDYDYSQVGMYFLTIVSHERELLFGQVVDNVMQLNGSGEIMRAEWLRTPEVRPNVILDAFVVMPNHVHGIIIISDVPEKGVKHYAPTVKCAPNAGMILNRRDVRPYAQTQDRVPNRRGVRPYAQTKQENETQPKGVKHHAPTAIRSPGQTVGAIVRGFKSVTTIAINNRRNTPGRPVWQRNYYEHIVRSEKALNAIRQYIDGNPGQWAQDTENPHGLQPNP
jgi:REP element-mobilizing transposase RayT